ncbi:MAG: hypothetical protein IKW62_04045 [Clostridia bacterium]|nr:hypothetical protein [Clostridia bacterium]
MHKDNNFQAITSANGINYYIVKSDDSNTNRPYGIKATLCDDDTDCSTVENLFFTEAEAEKYCKWLAENEVYPISLYEVLANIYIL